MEPPTSTDQKIPIWKRVLQLSFSHGGLCLLVVLYSMLGGALFELLEKQNEIEACKEGRKEYLDMENETLYSLLDVIQNTQPDSLSGEAQIKGALQTFRNNSLQIGYDGSWCEGYGHEAGPQHEWNYAGSLFFASTVITTIGYGHISPKTIWGRVLCISYAMVGIPLMLLFLADIGEVLADVFRYMYVKVICCGCLMKKKRSQDTGNQSSGSTEGLQTGNWTHAHIRNTSSTNRSPSLIASETTAISSEPPMGTHLDINKVGRTRFNLASTRTHSTEGTEIKQRSGKTAVHPQIVPIDGSALQARRRHLELSPSLEPLVVDDDDDDDDKDWDEINRVAVPLTVTMGIIGLYIFGGAVLFKYWEGWDITQASYFCFITLSTIGFGDVTPGRDFRSPQVNAQLIIGTIYAIFGMAILAMCFTLMQEEIMEKVTWLGLKLGIIDEQKAEE